MEINLSEFLTADKQITSALQKAIDTVAAHGGGRVTIPAGEYETGTVFLKSNVEVHLENGAVLNGSKSVKDYGHSSLKPLFSNDVGNVAMEWYYALIVAQDCVNISVTGSGVINGNGQYGAHFPNADDPYQTRPFLINLYRCKKVTITDVTLQNSGMYALFSQQSNDIVIDRVKIETMDSWNGDGLDFDGGENIIISNCRICAGDDAISPKTFSDAPIKNMTVTDCILTSRWAGIRFGVESSANMQDIVVSNCVFDSCNDGIKMQACGPGIYENISICNCVMRNVLRPIFVTLNTFRMSVQEGGVIPQNGKIRNIRIKDLFVSMPPDDFALYGDNTGMYAQRGLVVTGVPYNKIENFRLESIHFALQGGYTEPPRVAVPELLDIFEQYPEISHLEGDLPCAGIFLRHIDGLTMDNCSFTVANPDTRPLIFADDVEGMICRLSCKGDTGGMVKAHRSRLCVDGGKVASLTVQEEQAVAVLEKQSTLYREYLLALAPKIDAAENADTVCKISQDKIQTSDGVYAWRVGHAGKYVLFIPKLCGDCTVYVDKKAVAKHCLNQIYRYLEAFACEVDLQKDSVIKLEFAKEQPKIGHHGIGQPPYAKGIIGNVFLKTV